MASTAFSAITVLISGADLTAGVNYGVTAASEETCTITAPAGKVLDLSRLIIRMRTSAGSVTTSVNIGVGSTYSSIGLGAYRVAVPASGYSIVVGGKDFESARFVTTSAQSLILTVATGASTINYEAYMLPGGFTA
jgi:hypothetical protein